MHQNPEVIRRCGCKKRNHSMFAYQGTSRAALVDVLHPYRRKLLATRHARDVSSGGLGGRRPGTLLPRVQAIRRRRFSGMCYTSRDYRAEREARRRREEARERHTAGKTERREKEEAPKKRDRELVRA